MLSKAPFFSIHPLPPQIFPPTRKGGWGGALYAYIDIDERWVDAFVWPLVDAWRGGMCARHRSLRAIAEQQLTLTGKGWNIGQI